MGVRESAAAILLGLLNIALNLLALKAARGAPTLVDALTSLAFLPAFVAGCCSIVCMMWMYYSGAPLARGLLVAGATSIIFGTLLSAYLQRIELSVPEWLMWGSIAIFYCLRFTNLGRPS